MCKAFLLNKKDVKYIKLSTRYFLSILCDLIVQEVNKMKTKIMLIIFILTINANLLSQTSTENSWQWQYPKPQGNTLYDIHVFNKDTAIAVGDYGTIIKTTDGGMNWSVKYKLCDMDYLFRICFVNNNVGFAAGGKALLKTEDGGENWSVLKTDTTNHGYSCLYFTDEDTGFVFGTGQILKTTDGGKNWKRSFITQYDDIPSFQSVSFVDSQHGWGVCFGFYGNEIYRTTDGGKTWEQCTNINPRIYGSNGVHFIDKNTGWVVSGMGDIIKTTDGGQTWLNQRNDINTHYYSVYFINADTGWVVGNPGTSRLDTGTVLITTNGGTTWEDQSSEIKGYLNSVDYYDGVAWTVGMSGVIHRSTDEGKNWIAQRDEVYRFNSIYFVNETTGWVVGEKGIILHTTNGGDNWEEQYQNDSLLFNSLQSFDTKNVIIVGEKFDNGIYTNSIVMRTNDGGQSWQKHIDTLGASNSISFLTRNTGWIVGKRIYKTTDGGLSWQSQSNLFGLGRVQFIDEGTGWVEMASDTNLYKTTDGGKNWKSQLIDPNFTANSFYFINSNVGWAVGVGYNPVTYYWDKYIFKTTNGGNSWIQCSNVPNSVYNSVQFINENIGWACGGYTLHPSTIIKTTDGGNTWLEQDAPISNGIVNVFPLNEKICYAIGYSGIYKTNDGGGVTSVKDQNKYENNIPDKIDLYQNYPNPFNPSTIIEYKLTERGRVTIQIFNILGQKIDQLVDEEQNAGNYKIIWNPKGIASGVYFYRLTTASQIITKKMLLIR